MTWNILISAFLFYSLQKMISTKFFYFYFYTTFLTIAYYTSRTNGTMYIYDVLLIFLHKCTPTGICSGHARVSLNNIKLLGTFQEVVGSFLNQ